MIQYAFYLIYNTRVTKSTCCQHVYVLYSKHPYIIFNQINDTE